MERLLFKNDKIKILCINSEIWLVELMDNKEYNLTISKNMSPGLQILKIKPEEFLFSEFVKEQPDLEILFFSIIKKILLFCFSNHMVYWLEVGLPWFTQFSSDIFFKDEVKRRISDTQLPQKLRHMIAFVIK